LCETSEVVSKAFPAKLPKFQKRNAENSNRGEYITAFSERKQVLASIIS
jgi:hypothetical protein